MAHFIHGIYLDTIINTIETDHYMQKTLSQTHYIIDIWGRTNYLNCLLISFLWKFEKTTVPPKTFSLNETLQFVKSRSYCIIIFARKCQCMSTKMRNEDCRKLENNQYSHPTRTKSLFFFHMSKTKRNENSDNRPFCELTLSELGRRSAIEHSFTSNEAFIIKTTT